jgi:hypothetical protein
MRKSKEKKIRRKKLKTNLILKLNNKIKMVKRALDFKFEA